ncbi:MAG: DUF4118 domain-containing protein [Pseudomonadaceae bacterium]|nr:DUF4118 domain-containing protein [Pseudomonadaceae bacterium]
MPQNLTQTLGQMCVHIGILPGGGQESGLRARVKKGISAGLTSVVVMHTAPGAQWWMDNPHIQLWPHHEGLWDYGVLEKLVKLKPRLVVVPELSMPQLHPAEHAQLLENVAALLEAGIAVETSMCTVSIARISDTLNPPIQWPEHAALTGDYLRAHVGDYVVYDTSTAELLARYYRHELVLPTFLQPYQNAVFNQANLNRLREAMLTWVNSHVADMARHSNPGQRELPKVSASVSFATWLEHTMYALAGNMTLVALVHAMWFYGRLPFEAVGMLLMAGPIVTALYVNPFTALANALLVFLAFNHLFLPAPFAEQLADPAKALTLAVFVVSSLGVSWLATLHRAQEVSTREKSVQLQALLRLAHDLSYVDSLQATISAGVSNLRRTLALPAVMLQPDGTPFAQQGSYPLLEEADVAAARLAMERQAIVFPEEGGNSWLWCPLHLRRTTLGVLGVRMGADDTSPRLRTTNLLRAYTDLLASAMRRQELRVAGDAASQEAERESLRAALLSAVSHDLKTPLVSIIGSLSTLEQVGEGLPHEDRQELVASARQEAERLHSIIHNVLELTKLESGHIQPRQEEVDVAALFKSIVARCGRYYPKLEMKVEVAAERPVVLADPLLMEEVLFNLVDNAAKYAGVETPIELRVRAADDEGMALLQVADHGPGIVEHERERVFDKFFRSSQGDSRQAGSGLGLAISRAIVNASHGRIWMDGRHDGTSGTVANIMLPTVDAPLTGLDE